MTMDDDHRKEDNNDDDDDDDGDDDNDNGMVIIAVPFLDCFSLNSFQQHSKYDDKDDHGV